MGLHFPSIFLGFGIGYISMALITVGLYKTMRKQGRLKWAPGTRPWFLK